MAKSVLVGSVDYAPGAPVGLPRGAVHAGSKRLQVPGIAAKLSAHAYLHRESGRHYFLVPLGRPPLGGAAGGWRLYEYGPGDCPCNQ